MVDKILIGRNASLKAYYTERYKDCVCWHGSYTPIMYYFNKRKTKNLDNGKSIDFSQDGHYICKGFYKKNNKYGESIEYNTNKYIKLWKQTFRNF